tara:strand:- start:43007 stop:43474 length:468 start_codon:yes stop_codon:yes gene_type:complete
MKKYSEIRLKIPPPVVTLVFAGLMYLVNFIFTFEVIFRLQLLMVAAFFVIACFLLFPALIAFYKHKTTVNPLKPETASVLVIQGVYQYSRNPMYLGMASLLMAWCFWLGNPLNFIIFGLFIAYMNTFQIAVEEQALEKIFGVEFKRYKNKVRPWI